MEVRKKPKADLRKYHTVFIELGLAVALFLFVIITKVEIRPGEGREYVFEEQEVIEMEDIVQTEYRQPPPPPPRPPVPQEVPDEEIIEDFDYEIDAELTLGGSVELPPPPVPDQEEEEEEEEDFFIVVEQMPELIGGLESLQEKITYPESARRAGIEGRVYLRFIVNEEGEVEDPQVVRGIGGGADEEALRVIRETKFRPGMQRGRPVRVQYSLPILFRLQN